MAAKQEWLVVIPDHEGALEKRIEIRGKHLEGIVPAVRAGSIIVGGASLAAPLKEGEQPQMNGSVLIAKADTEAEIREMLEKDIYKQSGVWNLEKVQITPMRVAVMSQAAN